MTENNEIKIQKEYIEKVYELNKYKNLKYYILTMGCSLNENDSEKISGMLEEMNYTRTEDYTKADFIVFNTCCIRENAENTLFGRLGTVKKYKMNNENVYIVVVGCMTQQKHIIEKIKKSYRFVDMTLGTGAMNSFQIKLYYVFYLVYILQEI